MEKKIKIGLIFFTLLILSSIVVFAVRPSHSLNKNDNFVNCSKTCISERNNAFISCKQEFNQSFGVCKKEYKECLQNQKNNSVNASGLFNNKTECKQKYKTCKNNSLTQKSECLNNSINNFLECKSNCLNKNINNTLTINDTNLLTVQTKSNCLNKNINNTN